MHTITVLLMATFLKVWCLGVSYQVPSSGTASFLTSGRRRSHLFLTWLFLIFLLVLSCVSYTQFPILLDGAASFLTSGRHQSHLFLIWLFLIVLPVLGCVLLHPISYFTGHFSLSFSAEYLFHRVPGTRDCMYIVLRYPTRKNMSLL